MIAANVSNFTYRLGIGEIPVGPFANIVSDVVAEPARTQKNPEKTEEVTEPTQDDKDDEEWNNA